MKVRWKTLTILCLGLAFLNAGLFAAARVIVLGGFEELERESLRQHLQRARNALQEEVETLNRAAADYAVWDESWHFVEDGNRDFIRKNLDESVFANLHLDALLFIHSSGRVVYAQGYDRKGGAPAPPPPGLIDILRSHTPLWRGGGVSGFLSLPSGPMLVASRPIVTSGGMGPARGALIMGRFLDGREVASLAERTRLTLALRHDTDQGPQEIAVLPGGESLAGSVRFPDLLGRPSFALQVEIPRTITRQGRETVAYFARWNLLSSLAAGIALYLFLDLLARNRERGRESEERAAASLRESEQRYRQLSHEFRTLLDGIPDSLTLLDPDLKVVWANRSTLELWGEDIRPGEAFCRGQWKGDEPCEDCAAERCFASGRPEEGLDATPDGRVWGVKTFPLLDAEGKVTNVIRLASDITEKLRLREEAARASRLASLGELSAGVAHEINNPDAVILVNAPIVQEAFASALPVLDAHFREHGDFFLGKLPYSRMREEVPALCAEIVEGAGRIRRIVEDLKDFVRHGDSELREEFDLNGTIEAAVRLTAGTVRKATDSFRFEAENGSLVITGARHRIEQVLVNLIMNASQALTDRSQAISVSSSADPSGRRALVRVRDEGAGIAPEHLARLTEPFFTTRRQSGGTGLGLSVSSRIVADHGGTLTFSSVPGRGTTVTLELPLCPESQP